MPSIITQNEYLSLKKAALDAAFVHLNAPQREAVFCVRGPLLILAGAGSGKTTVLINRIAYLLRFGNAYEDERMPSSLTADDVDFLRACGRKGVASSQLDRLSGIVAVDVPPAWSVLAITFTNKAAAELATRLQKAIGTESESVLAATFHSACVRFLRRDIEKIGMARNFTIYDSDDSQRLIKHIIKDLNIDEKQFDAKSVKNAISFAKNDFVLVDEYEAEAGSDYFKKVVAQVYREYQRRLQQNNVLDFDDILLKTVQLLESDEDVLLRYQNRYRFILVDEYQDTNMVQYRLVELLSAGHQNLCVVGDDDQSIYRFRGATIKNILSFEDSFPRARVVKLEQNYRSTANILNAANEVISKNERRKGKTLWTAGGDGDKVVQMQFEDENGEAAFIAKSIRDAVAGGGKYSDHAVLYRINAVANSIERVLVRQGIPYRVFGGVRFYDHKEIKDMVAYLSVINNPSDNLHLERIINEPRRGIGDTTVATIGRIASECGISMMEVIARADEYAALASKAAVLRTFSALIYGLRDEIDGGLSLAEAYEKMLLQSGYLTMLTAGGIPEQGRVENVTELLSEIKKYENRGGLGDLSGFLEECALMTDFDNYDNSADAVILMTVHGAKGLEFNTVFVAACEENIFPSYMSMLEPADIEEERRLAYVAFTRAKKRLLITHTKMRMLYGRAGRNRLSRFAEDIPDRYKQVTGLESERGNPFARPGAYSYGRGTPQVSRPAAGELTKKYAPAKGQVFEPGSVVKHPTFGRGMVTAATKMGGDTMLEIAFDSCGTKRIMANFARLEAE